MNRRRSKKSIRRLPWGFGGEGVMRVNWTAVKTQILPLVILLISSVLFANSANAFAGEDAIDGAPWHHIHATERALSQNDKTYQGAGFAPPAVEAIAWHADIIDSYLYNPIWWASDIGAVQRIKASILGHEGLSKLHFDDTFTLGGVRDNWTRYAAGTLIGLYWASQQVVDGRQGDIAAAHHIIGVSIHAVQDFYSHSNWVDKPERRCMTWHQFSPQKRESFAPLYSGAYELPIGGGPKHHGAYSLSCSAISGGDLDQVFEEVCAKLSPFQNTVLCEEWRLCSGAATVELSIAGKLTENLVRLNPPGIALDFTRLARVQAVNRGIVKKDGSFSLGQDSLHFPRSACKDLVGADREDLCKSDVDMVFAVAKDLAIRSTIDWMDFIESSVQAMGPEMVSFWEQVKTTGSPESRRTQQFEQFNLLPYQFLSAGPYPVGNPATSASLAKKKSEGWYIRLRVRTGSGIVDGTDSDIYAELDFADGTSTSELLDYLPITDKTGYTDNPILVYDDFENGDDDVYTLGPFSHQPVGLRLRNDASSALDTFAALLDDFGNSISEGIHALTAGGLSIIGGDEDFVGQKQEFITHKIVENLLANDGEAVADIRQIIDGGAQGKYEMTFRLSDKDFRLTDAEREEDWREIEIHPRSLTLLDASNDRLTDEDEPFVIVLTSPLNGTSATSHAYLSEVIDGLKINDSYFFPKRKNSGTFVKIPPHGGAMVAVQVFESDSEGPKDREELRKTFETGLDRSMRTPPDRFLHTLGRAVGADWFVSGVSAFGYYRGSIPKAGSILQDTHIGMIEENMSTSTLAFGWENMKTLAQPGKTIDEFQSTQKSPWVDRSEGQTAAVAVETGFKISAGGETASIGVLQCPPAK